MHAKVFSWWAKHTKLPISVEKKNTLFFFLPTPTKVCGHHRGAVKHSIKAFFKASCSSGKHAEFNGPQTSLLETLDCLVPFNTIETNNSLV